MPTTDPLSRIGTKKTHQTKPVLGRTDQVKNNAGGYVFEIDKFSQLRRFLTMGTAGGTYYVGEDQLTQDNAAMVIEFTKDVGDHLTMIDMIVEISVAGRAPKVNPALFALAVACQIGEQDGKDYARKQINKVVRTGSHLFTFMGYLDQFGGWGRGIRRAVAAWYTEKTAEELAYQMVKYRQRNGWTHRDVLRKVHPKSDSASQRAVLEWAVKGDTGENDGVLPSMIAGYEWVQQTDRNIPAILETHKLPWEALPDSAMNDTKVWDKLLDNQMPIRALVRHLPRLTQLGMIAQMGGRTNDVVDQLLNPEAVSKSRIHPIDILVALKTYRQGHGLRSSWHPAGKIVDALDEMFYLAFDNVEPTNKRTVVALDVSGSMRQHGAGKLSLNAAEVSAAMAMTTIRTEQDSLVMGFSSGEPGNGTFYRGEPSMVTDLPIGSRQRLDDVIRTVTSLRAKPTDCSLPMLNAIERELDVDTFVVYTDNETFHGAIHPYQALQLYRKKSGIDAKLVVVSCTPTKFSIADPKDSGMLDISGFDSAVPQLIAGFSKGDI